MMSAEEFEQLTGNTVDNWDKSSIIKENEVIGRNIGASANNYLVRLLDGNHVKNLLREPEITKIKVFADENDYNIPAYKWQKGSWRGRSNL